MGLGQGLPWTKPPSSLGTWLQTLGLLPSSSRDGRGGKRQERREWERETCTPRWIMTEEGRGVSGAPSLLRGTRGPGRLPTGHCPRLLGPSPLLSRGMGEGPAACLRSGDPAFTGPSGEALLGLPPPPPLASVALWRWASVSPERGQRNKCPLLTWTQPQRRWGDRS